MFRYISTALVAVALLGTNACLQSESVPCGTDGPVCPKGWICIAELNACIDPIETLCGNGVLDAAEECDDGNLANHDECNWDCRPPRVGDGFLDAPEVCDDGNTVNGDGCNAEGTSVEICGDRVRSNYTHGDNVPPEECDEGGVNTATCNADCTTARCGDGKTNTAANEACDDGDLVTRIAADTKECNKDCTVAACGDGKTNNAAAEQCDTGRYCANGTACTAAAQCAGIGDGLCATRDFDCCTRTCQNPKCGNGVFEAECVGFPLEVCDDGSHCENLRSCTLDSDCVGVGDGLCKPRNGTGCDLNCAFPEICGDGQVQAYAPYFEVCDDGLHCSDGLTACFSSDDCGALEDKTCATRSGTGCAANCASAEICGDGVLNPYPRRQPDGSFLDPEVCDDGRQCADGRRCNTSPECADSVGDQVCRVRNADGCGLNCLSVEVCGDGVLNDYRHQMVNLKPIIGVATIGLTINRSEVCDDGSHCVDGTPCLVDAECAGVPGEDKLCGPRDGDGCSADCLSAEACGDGYFNDYSHVDLLGTSFDAEICDDGNNTPDDGCSASCSSTEQCGNAIKDSGEECDEGADINGTELSIENCTRNCTISACGNSRKDPGEQCDRSSALGGNLAEGPCNLTCLCNICGDSVVNTVGEFALHCGGTTKLEQCDSGGINSESCNFDCTATVCGDGIVNFQASESCDEGPPADGSPGSKQTTRCNSDCSIAFCGDGKLNLARSEVCDDGNNTNGDGCAADCGSTEFCGDGTVNSYVHVDGLGGSLPSELCDDGTHCTNGESCASDADCGGVVDDCQVRAGTGCSPDCLSVEICGDSYLSDYAPINETCDDGNEISQDGCDGDTCVVESGWSCPALGTPCFEVCGDDLVRGEESCDDGDQVSLDGCDGTCQQELGWDCPTDGGDGGECAPVCGDFLIRGAETCDDGDQTGGDGCGATCLAESGWSCPGVNGGVGGVCTPVCGDGVVSGNEECDDGDTESSDGCSSICREELGWVCPESAGQPVGGNCVTDCGDFLIRGTEQCDDGNLVANDGCGATCQFEDGWVCPAGFSVIGGVCTATCGDGLVRGAESCDDNDTASGDGCDSGCKAETGWSCPVAGGNGGDCSTVCGDGLIRGTESCDENNAAASGGCTLCVAQDGWRCPTASGSGGLCTAICGDGKVRGGETCDDTNLVSNDGCSAICAKETGWNCPIAGGNGGACATICGDTLIRGAETCDEGGSASAGGCTSCKAQSGWSCPVASGNGGTCTTVCGDRLVRGAETCDDGGVAPGDGCGATCLAESGWSCPTSGGSGGACATVCGDNIKAGAEQCDDNNTNSGDGCDSGCRGETPVVVADTFRALDGESSYAISVATLTANDSVFARPTFNPALLTTCGAGGGLVHDSIGGTLTFTKAASPACATPWQDSFTYTLCNPAVPTLCTTGSVAIRLNRLPVLADATSCVLAGSASTSLNVASVYSDPDSHPVNVSTITATAPAGGTRSVSGTVVTWTPTNANAAAAFSIPLQACDSGDPSGCDPATWTVLWNDLPVLLTTLASSPRIAPKGTNVDTLLTALIVDPGAVPVFDLSDPLKPWIATAIDSVTVSASENGTYAATATTGKGTCSVRSAEADVRYTTPGNAADGDDSCWVKVCEVCSGATVCAKQEMKFAVQSCADTQTGVLQDLGCTAGAPICKLNHPSNNPTCVACETNPQCLDSNLPVCSPDSFTCIKCSDTGNGQVDTGCANPFPACRTANPKACVECEATSDCALRSDKYDTCDTAANICGECTAATASVDCSPGELCVTRTVSDVDRKVCVECVVDPDCSNGDVCDPATDTCVECATSANCSGGTPVCSASKTCVECVDAATDCSAGEQCDAGVCVGCIGNPDCTAAATGAVCASGVCGCVTNADCLTLDYACTGGTCVAPAVVVTADTFGFRLVPGTTSWIPSDFTDNDSFADDNTFALVSGSTGCGGVVDFDAGSGLVTLVPPAVPPAAPANCDVQDSFDYEVCNTFAPANCGTATVTIIYNRSPVVTDAPVCVAAGTASAMVNVASNYTDPDSNPLATGGVSITDQGAGGNTVVGNQTELTFTPSVPATAAEYVMLFQMCDDGTADIWDSACTEAFLTVSYNDDPTLADLATAPTLVEYSGTVEFLFTSILTSWGTVEAASPFASIKVSATENGVYDTTATATDGGTCSIVNTDTVRFVAGSADASPSCWVQVCEVCGATPACVKTEIKFTTQFCVPDAGSPDRGCVALEPICDDTVTPSCVFCIDLGAGEFDTGCEAETPGFACKTSVDPTVCVECTDDEDCSVGDTCDVPTNACVTP